MKKVVTIIGTRPNLIKISQFERAFAMYNSQFSHQFIYTNQHYDENLSSVFFKEFGVNNLTKLTPQKNQSVPQQIANIMLQLQKLFLEIKPDLVIVVGDVNSTLAAAITANKLNIKIAHLESGLRSFDKEMPEEINRIITDKLSDIFFLTEKSALQNLEKEGLKNEHTFFVGNTMIDSLVAFEDKIDNSKVLHDYELTNQDYLLMTMHRPRNVDSFEKANQLVDLLVELEKKHFVVFPMHPRTSKSLLKHNLLSTVKELNKLIITEPLGYFDFQKLIKHAKIVLTDSGGIQEETTYRQIPCLTIRENTERPVTIDIGTNQLVKFNNSSLLKKIDSMLSNKQAESQIPPNWDGKTTERIAEIISTQLLN